MREDRTDPASAFAVLLEFEGEFLPAWIAGRLSLMMADFDQHILRWKLDL